MSLQLVFPNEHSTLPQLSNTAAQIVHGLAVKSNANLLPDPGATEQTTPDVHLAAAQPENDQNRPSNTHSQDLPPTSGTIPVKLKTCVKCKQEKTTMEFHKNSRSSDGLHSYCKDCNRAQALAHIKAEKARKALARAAKKLAANKT